VTDQSSHCLTIVDDTCSVLRRILHALTGCIHKIRNTCVRACISCSYMQHVNMSQLGQHPRTIWDLCTHLHDMCLVCAMSEDSGGGDPTPNTASELLLCLQLGSRLQDCSSSCHQSTSQKQGTPDGPTKGTCRRTLAPGCHRPLWLELHPEGCWPP